MESIACQSWIGFALGSCGLFVRGPRECRRRRSTPEFGPNVLVFNPSMPAAAIQQQIDKVYAMQQHSEFGVSAAMRCSFLPGEYHVDVPVGFYTQVLGLGATPDAVHITGNVHSDASLAAQQCDLHLLASR